MDDATILEDGVEKRSAKNRDRAKGKEINDEWEKEYLKEAKQNNIDTIERCKKYFKPTEEEMCEVKKLVQKDRKKEEELKKEIEQEIKEMDELGKDLEEMEQDLLKTMDDLKIYKKEDKEVNFEERIKHIRKLHDLDREVE